MMMNGRVETGGVKATSAVIAAAGLSSVDEQLVALHRTLKRIAKARAHLDLQEAEALREAQKLRLWKQFGHTSLVDYMVKELGYSSWRTAEDRLRLANALPDLPKLTEAIQSGAINMTQARELARVATPETEAKWVEKALDLNVRQVEQAVAGHSKGDLPEDPVDPRLVRKTMYLSVRPETELLFREVRKALEAERGEKLDEDAVMEALCRAMLRSMSCTPVGGTGGAGGESVRQVREVGDAKTLCTPVGGAGGAGGESVRQVRDAKTLCTPVGGAGGAGGESVRQVRDAKTLCTPVGGAGGAGGESVRQVRDAKTLCTPVGGAGGAGGETKPLCTPVGGADGEGVDSRSSDGESGRQVGDAKTLCTPVGGAEHAVAAGAPYRIAVTLCRECKRGWQHGAGSLVEMSPPDVERAMCDAQWIGDLDSPLVERARQDIPPATRRKVLQRDEFRCRVPGCRSHTNIDIHHVVHREHGGTNELFNLISICEAHHLAHHAGTLVIGRDGDELTFRFEGRNRFTRKTREVATKEALRKRGLERAHVQAIMARTVNTVGESDLSEEQWLAIALRYAGERV